MNSCLCGHHDHPWPEISAEVCPHVDDEGDSVVVSSLTLFGKGQCGECGHLRGKSVEEHNCHRCGSTAKDDRLDRERRDRLTQILRKALA